MDNIKRSKICRSDIGVLVGFLSIFFVASCATPEQLAAREEYDRLQKQKLTLTLATKCDAGAAELMSEQMNIVDFFSNPIYAKRAKQYQNKVNSPIFQSCYKMAWDNHLNHVRLKNLEEEQERKRLRELSQLHRPKWCRSLDRQNKPVWVMCAPLHSY